MATGIGREKFLTTLSNSPDPKIGGRCKQRAIIFTGTELYRFKISIGCNAKFCNFWMVAMATGV